LEAVTSSLSGSRIDVGELREDANELTAVVHSIQWLADVCAPSGSGPVAVSRVAIRWPSTRTIPSPRLTVWQSSSVRSVVTAMITPRESLLQRSKPIARPPLDEEHGQLKEAIWGRSISDAEVSEYTALTAR
jgi:hypothetical protein